jgi:hypothetical protein
MANSEHDAMTSETVREQLTKIAQECGLNPLWCMDALEQAWQAALSTQPQPHAELKILAAAMRKVLPPCLLQEVIDHCDPLSAFLRDGFNVALPAPPAKPQEGK